MTLQRLMFASCHAYIDPISDAAWMARWILRLLAARGVDCRAITTGVLDGEREAKLPSILEAPGHSFTSAIAELSRTGSVEVLDLSLDGVRVTLMPTASSLGTVHQTGPKPWLSSTSRCRRSLGSSLKC